MLSFSSVDFGRRPFFVTGHPDYITDVELAGGSHGGLLRTAASTAFHRRSTKGCTSSSLLDVCHGCRSQLAAACIGCSKRSCRRQPSALDRIWCSCLVFLNVYSENRCLLWWLRGLPRMQGIQVDPGPSQFRRLWDNEHRKDDDVRHSATLVRHCDFRVVQQSPSCSNLCACHKHSPSRPEFLIAPQQHASHSARARSLTWIIPQHEGVDFGRAACRVI